MPSKLENAANQLLSERLQPIGFRTTGFLSFSRTANGCDQLINVGCRSENGKIKFTCTLGLRFDRIESLLRPKNFDRSYPTVFCPIHLLRAEPNYYEWEGGDNTELIVAVESMIEEINAVGIPFFERFGTIEAIKKELSSSVISDLLILSPHQRISTLAAIALLHGERGEAENLFANAMKDPRNQNAGKSHILKELRSQLLAEGNQ